MTVEERLRKILNRRATIEDWLVQRSKSGEGLTAAQCKQLALCLGKPEELWADQQKKLIEAGE